MAGLAATLDASGAIDRLATALAPRGDDGALCRLKGPHGTALEVAMRAVIPAIARVVGGTSGTQTVGAFAVDGVASVTRLDTGYASAGPLGLLGGEDPYAVIFVDAERELLVVARNGAGPGLYYAAHGRGWLVASEPAALLHAGITAQPEPAVVSRFVSTGACDDTEATFFRGVRRVLADEAVVLGRDGGLRRHTAVRANGEQSVDALLRDAVSGGRIAIRLAPGVAGAALLGAALGRPDRPRPLPVHTAVLSGVDGPAGHTPAVLVPMPHGAIRHTPHTFAPASLDLDGFLRDMGEPVPDLDFIVSWEVARLCDGGNVDTVVDSATGAAPHCAARVHDRLAARYGVGLRSPLRGSGVTRAELESVVAQTLPASIGRYAVNDSAGAITSTDILLALRDDVAAALASTTAERDGVSGPSGVIGVAGVDALRRLSSGEAVDADMLFRQYLVERWLRSVVAPLRTQAQAGPAAVGPPSTEITVDGVGWSRVPVRTEVFGPGDRVTAKAAWYVSHALAESVPALAEVSAGSSPWLAILSAKPVAVGQHRVCPLWEIRPTRLARVLARLAGRRQPRLAEAWTMQVALEDGGFIQVSLGVVAGFFGFSHWSGRLLPVDAVALFPPRADAVTPADSAVVRVPFKPDEAAAGLAESLRLALPTAVADLLIGCAIVSAGAAGPRLLGYAPGPAAETVSSTADLIAQLCADDPAGQGGECTPVVIAVRRSKPPRVPGETPGRAVGVVKVSRMSIGSPLG